MSTIVTRAGKGSALTHNEVDANFNNLNTDKAEKTVANTFTANQIVSVTDNTNAALRITQLGSGNALLVEDSANPDSTPFVIDGLGKINIGSLVQYAMTPATPYTQWNNADNQYASVGLTSWQAGTNTQSKLIFGRGDSNIVGDFSNAVDSGDNLGSVHWTGSDGVGFIESASISASVDGTPGTNDMPGRLVFSTTADGASTPTERLRIASTGAFGLSGGNYGTSGQALISSGSSSAPVWNSISLTTSVSGILPIANGGTNSTATATAGGIGYGTGTAHAYTAAGTSGQVLTSNGASAPTWAAASNGTSISQTYFLSQS